MNLSFRSSRFAAVLCAGGLLAGCTVETSPSSSSGSSVAPTDEYDTAGGTDTAPDAGGPADGTLAESGSLAADTSGTLVLKGGYYVRDSYDGSLQLTAYDVVPYGVAYDNLPRLSGLGTLVALPTLSTCQVRIKWTLSGSTLTGDFTFGDASCDSFRSGLAAEGFLAEVHSAPRPTGGAVDVRIDLTAN